MSYYFSKIVENSFDDAIESVTAHLAENKIGTMLPYNVIVRETSDGKVEVVAVDPMASMMAVQNEALGGIASEVQSMLKNVIEGL